MAQILKSKDDDGVMEVNRENQTGNVGADAGTLPEVGSVLEQRKQRQEEGDSPQDDNNEHEVEEEEAEGEKSDASKPKSKKFFSRIKEKMIKLKDTLKEEIVGAPEAANFRDYVKDPAKEEDKNEPDSGVDAAGAPGSVPGELVPGDATPVAGVQSGKSIPEEQEGHKEVLGKDFDFEPLNEAAVTGENEKTIADHAKNEYFAKHPEQARGPDVTTETVPGESKVAEPNTPDQSETASTKLSAAELRRMDEGLLAMYQKAGIPMPGKGTDVDRSNEAGTGSETGMSKTAEDIGKASAYRPTDVLPGQPGKAPQEVTTDSATSKNEGAAPTREEEAVTRGGTAPRSEEEAAELVQIRREQKSTSDVGTGGTEQPTEQGGGVGSLPEATEASGVSKGPEVAKDREHATEAEGKKDHTGGILGVIAESLGLVKHDTPTTNADVQQVPK